MIKILDNRKLQYKMGSSVSKPEPTIEQFEDQNAALAIENLELQREVEYLEHKSRYLEKRLENYENENSFHLIIDGQNVGWKAIHQQHNAQKRYEYEDNGVKDVP